MATSTDLKAIFAEARPLIEQQLDLTEMVAGLRDAATAKGLDWSQIKALLKAQIQDERDETGNGKRVQKIVDKAEHASAYADMLGLAKMNENIFSSHSSEASSQATTKAGAEPPPAPAAHSSSVAEPQTPPATDQAGDDATPASPAAISAADVPLFLLKDHKPLRPLCLQPDNCAGYGSHTCHACIAAFAEEAA